jgi:ribose transport system substrate-binding protein
MSNFVALSRRALLGAAMGLTATLGLAAGASAEDAKVNLGVSIPAATHGFTAGIVWWANEAEKELEAKYPNLQVTVKTAGGAPEQANQLQDLVTVTGIDALVIFPFESASLTQPVAQVKKSGVYVTVVDRGLTDTSAQDAYIAGDNTAFGQIPAEYFAKKYEGKGTIVALRGIPTTLDNERWDAFTAVINQHPGMKILDAQYGNWNRDDAFKVTQDFLTRFKDIDLIWAADDDMAFGVLQAIRQAGREDGIKEVFGGAGAKGMVKLILDDSNPLIKADVSYSPKFIYDAIVMTAEARLKGEALPETFIIPSALITKDNAADYYFPDSPF